MNQLEKRLIEGLLESDLSKRDKITAMMLVFGKRDSKDTVVKESKKRIRRRFPKVWRIKNRAYILRKKYNSILSNAGIRKEQYYSITDLSNLTHLPRGTCYVIANRIATGKRLDVSPNPRARKKIVLYRF